jgi:hypothetical protein
MTRSTIQLPELRNTCWHYDSGESCGVDSQPCIGHKVERREGAGKQQQVAEYRHKTPVWDNDLECWVDGPWILCPKLRRESDAEPTVPDMR